MPQTLEAVAKVVSAKAAKIGLSVAQLTLVLELCEDLEKHANVQALAFAKHELGSCLTLMSLEARYLVWLVKTDRESIKQDDQLIGRFDRLPRDGETTLKCVCEPFDSKDRVIWSGSDSVESFEGLRARILDLEGYEIVQPQREAMEKVIA